MQQSQAIEQLWSERVHKKIVAQRMQEQERLCWKRKKRNEKMSERHGEQQKKNAGQPSNSAKCGQDTTQ